MQQNLLNLHSKGLSIAKRGNEVRVYMNYVSIQTHEEPQSGSALQLLVRLYAY